MSETESLKKAQKYLETFCSVIRERCTGSEGNRQSTEFFRKELEKLGWEPELSEFEAMDWVEHGATLETDGISFNVLASPYSFGIKGEAELVSASDITELENSDALNKIILLHGEIAKEPLMPKNFVFYNPEEHQRIIALLEKKQPMAIICATGRNSSLAGGVYPFPLIEDGDFNIPSVYMTEEEGEKLKPHAGKKISIESWSERIPGKGYNVLASRGNRDGERIIITAHIDAKKGTPGAIDNATGVIVLLLLAELLKDYSGDKYIGIVALNGEDYYGVPGQMKYIMENQEYFKKTILNINIDGAGYKTGPSAFSLFDLPMKIMKEVQDIINTHPDIEEGVPWPQGDHSIFLQYGIPAIAVSSKWFIDNINDQDITHTPKDNMDIVDCNKLIEIASALNILIRNI